jgi:hypothetical protein
VASAVAVLSATKLIKLAKAAGWSGGVAPLLFLAIDGAGVAGGLTAFYGASKAARNYGWFVLCESTSLSLLGNEAADWVQTHGYLPGWMTAVVAAAVPLQLPLTVHQTVLLAHRDDPAIDTDRPQASQPTASTDPITGPIPPTDRTAAADWRSTGSGRHSADRLGPIPPAPLPTTDQVANGPVPHPPQGGSIDSLDPVDPSPEQHISSSTIQPVEVQAQPNDPRSTRSTPARSIEVLRVDVARAIETGALDPRPTAEAIRKLLSISPSRARLLRDEFADHDLRPELRVVAADPDDQAAG